MILPRPGHWPGARIPERGPPRGRRVGTRRMEYQAMAHWFDDLARRLAGGGLTRREALRGIGAAAGATIVAGLPTAALARDDHDDHDNHDNHDGDHHDDDHGNSDCAHF